MTGRPQPGSLPSRADASSPRPPCRPNCPTASPPELATRAPLGIAQAMVFQQHPEGMRGLRGTDPELWPGHELALAFDTAEDLVAAAQVGMIELHT